MHSNMQLIRASIRNSNILVLMKAATDAKSIEAASPSLTVPLDLNKILTMGDYSKM